MKELLQSQRSLYLILSILFVFHVVLLWPGMMSPDSFGQLSMAVTQNYSDHHPPMMSFVWGYLLKIYDGSGPIYTLHLALFYGGIALLLNAFRDNSYRWAFLLLSIAPQIASYGLMVWKDVAFAFAFFFVVCALINYHIHGRRPTLLTLPPLLLVLFYGAGAKYQAQFCAPFVLLWIAYLFFKPSLMKTLAATLLLGGIFQISLDAFNDHFVPEEKKNHSWQMVKLFDLAAISVSLDQDLIPQTFKKENYSFDEIKKKFNHQRVDDMVFGRDAVIKIGQNPEERSLIWHTWALSVLKHPISYIKHRTCAMAYVLLSIPGFTWVVKFLDDNFEKDSMVYKSLYYPARFIGTLFLTHLFIPFFALAYFVYGFRNRKKDSLAEVLMFTSLIALSMIALLFGMSMAGTPRYTYISAVLVNLSHVIAFISWKKRRQSAIKE